ncbi:hypothetical protein [Microbacterium panaciterrae]|uniref:Lipoprotein n=1 Tax=Microbacterium panaciterrae TaxID=985759 RepID=A0ABP8PT36_9MICO
MTRRTATTITVATLAAVAVLGLTACDPGTPKPTGSSSPSPTATSTPTASATDRPMPPQVDAPKDGDAAVAAANKTYEAYLEAQIPFFENVSLGASYLSGYVLQGGSAWTTLNSTADHGVNTIASGGPFVWTLNGAMSEASTSTNSQNGQKVDFGGVHLYGCIDDTKIKYSVPEIKNTPGTPVAVTLVYVPDAHAWMIQEDRRMRASDGEAMPQC